MPGFPFPSSTVWLGVGVRVCVCVCVLRPMHTYNNMNFIKETSSETQRGDVLLKPDCMHTHTCRGKGTTAALVAAAAAVYPSRGTRHSPSRHSCVLLLFGADFTV